MNPTEPTQQPAPPTPPVAPPPIATAPPKYKLPAAFKTAVVLFGMAASVVLAIIPSVLVDASYNDSPSFIVFLLAGLVGVACTAFIFSFISKLGLGFNKSVITLAVGYNAVIAVIKLVLAPMSLYTANRQQAFDTSLAGDPNTPLYYAFVGAAVLLLYVVVFRIIYRHFQKRFKARQAALTVNQPVDKHKHKLIFGWPSVIVLIAVIGVVVSGGGGILLLPLLAIGPPLSYLTYVFGSIGIAVFLAIVTAIVMAYKSFAEVEKQATATGDAALLASFFWVGLSLILLYHVMWIVFMVALVATWPFKTYTPK